MSAETVESVEETSDVDEAVETEARSLGWVPKDKFRGNPEHWNDAKSYVENGQRLMPLLKKQNERLNSTVKNLQGEMAQIRAELNGSREDFETLQEQSNEELKRRAEDTRRQILGDLKKAKDAGDTDAEVELTEQLGDVRGVIKDLSEVKPKERTVIVSPAYDESKDADYQAWLGDNPWFSDTAKRRQAMAVALVLRDEEKNLTGRAFYDKLDERLEEAGVNTKETKRTKVGSGQGGGSGTSTSSGHSYSDLTSEAKKACDGYAEKFVKENGRFKTVADYRKHYVAQLEAQGATEFFR